MTASSSLSEYERLRAERIQRNNERLASLGLLDAKPKQKARSRASYPFTPKKKRTLSAAVTPSPVRASRRVKRRTELYQPSFHDYQVKSEKIPFVGDRVAKYFDGELFLGTITEHDTESGLFSCVYDDGDKEDFSREELVNVLDIYQREGKQLDGAASSSPTKLDTSKTVKTTKSKFRCEIPLDVLSSPLTKAQQKIIDHKMEGDFLGKFEDYLTNVDEISESNRRNVMKQITKLAEGEGIRYESKAYGWPEGCFFMKGVKIGPHDDILKLMDIGQQCEDNWGRDHGNGWLLSHPLKKLYMFQQYHLKDVTVSV
ncbi:hypothetical protein ACHAWX_005781 [Stephanocyclus meneghinianus]